MSPGRERSREIVTGRVSLPLRVRKLVAPNSPIETAKAKAADAPSARDIRGRSTVSQVCSGVAPRVDATDCRLLGICCTTGSTMRTTSGKAIKEWASGVMIQADRKSYGAVSYVIRRPSPIVTAETVSGSIEMRSSHTNLDDPYATPRDTMSPRTVAITMAHNANCALVEIAENVVDDATARHPLSVKRLVPGAEWVSERQRSAVNGAMTTAAVVSAMPYTSAIWLRVLGGRISTDI